MNYIEPTNIQGKWMFKFYKEFCENMEIDDKIKYLPFYHSQNKCYDGNYIRKENHDYEIVEKNKYVPLFIDIIDDKQKMQKYCKLYYHIPFGVITYFQRNVPITVLLKPIKEIYNSQNKTKFCSYCFKNTTWKNAVKRHNFYIKLNKKKKVDRLRDQNRFNDNLFNSTVELYKPYMFNIAFENDITPGYINEKIFNAFLAGCIPIFDGTRDIFKYFNKDSFIFAGDFKNLDDLINYILKVDADENLKNKYLNTPPCSLEKLKKLFWWKKDIQNL